MIATWPPVSQRRRSSSLLKLCGSFARGTQRHTRYSQHCGVCASSNMTMCCHFNERLIDETVLQEIAGTGAELYFSQSLLAY